MNWWLIAIIVIVVIVFVKYREMRHKFGLIAIILVLLFIVATFGQIYFSNNLDLTTFDGMVHAGRVYFDWLGGAVGNIVSISGYAIKQNWGISSNSTITNVRGNVK